MHDRALACAPEIICGSAHNGLLDVTRIGAVLLVDGGALPSPARAMARQPLPVESSRRKRKSILSIGNIQGATDLTGNAWFSDDVSLRSRDSSRRRAELSLQEHNFSITIRAFYISIFVAQRRHTT